MGPNRAQFTLRSVKIASDNEDEDGVLVLVDGRIVAVLARLQAEYHGEDQGRWYLEAGFGRCSGTTPPPFQVLSDALRWIAGRLGLENPDLSAAQVALDGAPPAPQ